MVQRLVVLNTRWQKQPYFKHIRSVHSLGKYHRRLKQQNPPTKRTNKARHYGLTGSSFRSWGICHRGRGGGLGPGVARDVARCYGGGILGDTVIHSLWAEESGDGRLRGAITPQGTWSRRPWRQKTLLEVANWCDGLKTEGEGEKMRWWWPPRQVATWRCVTDWLLGALLFSTRIFRLNPSSYIWHIIGNYNYFTTKYKKVENIRITIDQYLTKRM